METPLLIPLKSKLVIDGNGHLKFLKLMIVYLDFGSVLTIQTEQFWMKLVINAMDILPSHCQIQENG